MELRHLRYFVAIAEEGSITLAAGRRLHTAQPSLSRQLRELEAEVGAQLLVRSVQGVELTPAGRAFLDHARLALSQVEAASEAARRVAQPAKLSFVMGFLTGTEIDWFSEAVRLIHDELPSIEVMLVSQTSPELVDSLARRKVDVAFLRPEPHPSDLEYRLLGSEPLVVVLPSDHRLAVHDAIDPREIEHETFINVSDTAPHLRVVIDEYLRKSRLDIVTVHEAANMYMAISMVASTKGVAVLPLYAMNFLPPSVVTRPLAGIAPTVDLVLGYHKANASPLLQLFLSRTDDLVARVSTRSIPTTAG
jgi:LysR family hca operon transcriptional activator